MFPTTEPLPFWDTFEVLFFAFTGLFIGVVLGILLPSIWRSLRRFFRQYKGYTHVPQDPSRDGSKASTREDHMQLLAASPIEEAFVKARWFTQSHQARKAVQVYVAILTNENTSKNQTNLALFELAQTYLLLSLKEKAFETGYELLKRKPHHNDIVETVLLPCVCEPLNLGRLKDILATYKAPLRAQASQRLAHALCQAGRQNLETSWKNLKKSLEFAKQAQKADPNSLRAKLDIWQYTSLELWHSRHMDTPLMWLTLIHDIKALVQTLAPTNLSPAPAQEHLAWCFAELAKTPFATFTALQSELMQQLKPLQENPKTKSILRRCLIFALNQHTPQNAKPILHKCQNCSTIEESFYWHCLRCGAYETYEVYEPH